MKTLKEKLEGINEGETVARLNAVIDHIVSLEGEGNGDKAKPEKEKPEGK